MTSWGLLTVTIWHGIPFQEEAVTALEAGAQVVVVQADVAVEEDVARVLCSAPTPLRGIVHAAGVLDDGLLATQSLQRFEQVMSPKVQGTECRTNEKPCIKTKLFYSLGIECFLFSFASTYHVVETNFSILA